MSETRGLQIGVVIAVAVAGVGLISGVRGTGDDLHGYVAKPPPLSPRLDALGAPSYSDLRVGMHGPNAAVQPAWWQQLRGADLFAPVSQTDAERDAALERRVQRRAYDGAPPTIPHAIDQLALPSCLTCHEHGAIIGGRVAPAMSHAPQGSCVQCHVVSTDPRPGAGTPPSPASSFVGLAPPRSGARAWTGAPPAIPHTTWMRERCESCHGVFGARGMKSTHIWRQSCLQCHAPSAALDQRAPIAGSGASP